MTTTKAPGDGLPAQLPDEDFHAYMSRLYREQGMPRGDRSPYLHHGSPGPALRPVLAIPEQAGLGPLHRHPIRRRPTPQKPQGTMLNITAVGRLGKDPELRTTQKGQEITSFSLGVSVFAKGEQQTVWLKCSIWGKRGDTLRQYCHQGPTGHHQRKAVPGHLDGQGRRSQ